MMPEHEHKLSYRLKKGGLLLLLNIYLLIPKNWTLPAYILNDVDSGGTDETAKEGNRHVQE